MKSTALAILIFLSFPSAFATTSDLQIQAIQTKMQILDQRIAAARVQILSDLTPQFITAEIAALRRMILNLLTPENDKDYVAGADRAAYLGWALVFNRAYGRPNRYGYEIRASTLPLIWRQISPELYRLLLEKAKLQNNFSAIQWNKSVTWRNLPLAIRLLRFGMDEPVSVLSQYESLLDQTRRITPTQLKLLLLDVNSLFNANGMLNSEKLGNILRMKWREAHAALECRSGLHGMSPSPFASR